ncbi:MAG: PQQ-like beta-propeller repeat protein [Verrucomicrobia bacterium]|nr:PQQ-like beta-propeller repeat protein [Verrucomicrobiota bacterium]
MLNATAADWPQLLGPDRNGISPETNLATAWPKAGPPVVWQKKIGAGFAGPVVADGKLILFHRLGDTETVECLDAKSGEPRWKFDYPTAYQDDFGFDPGPRATPTIADGKVFTYGADGALHALDFATGKILWSVDGKKDFAAPKGFFGRACSPLVEGGTVIVNVGGKNGSSVVAFDQGTGKVRWKVLDDEPGYSSPSAATVGGQRMVFVLTRGQFAGLDPADGRAHFQLPFRPSVQASVTGATPLVVGDQVFISAAYDLGAALFRIKHGPPEKIWAGDEQLSLQYSTAVHRDGFLYGLHGRHDSASGTELRCVEFNTSKVRWSRPGFHGANVMLAGDQLLVLTEKGELIRARAAPEKFQETGHAQILGSGVRAYPALADGMFYARDKARLAGVDLAGGRNQ